MKDKVCLRRGAIASLFAAAFLALAAPRAANAIGLNCDECTSALNIPCELYDDGPVTTCYLFLTHPDRDIASCSLCDCSVPSSWVCSDQWDGHEWVPVTCATQYDYVNCVPLGTFTPTLYENGYIWAPTATQAAYGPEPVKGLADTHDHVFGEYNFGGAWFQGRVDDPTPPTTCSGNPNVDATVGIDDVNLSVAEWLGAAFCVYTNIVGFNSLLFPVSNCLPLDQTTFAGTDAYAWGDHAVMKAPNNFMQSFFGSDIGKHDPVGWPKWSGMGHHQLWEGWLREAHEKAPFEYWLWTHVYVQNASGGIGGFQQGYEDEMMAFAATDPTYAGQSFQQLQDNTDAQVALFRSDYASNMQTAYEQGAVGLNLILISAVNFRDLCGLMVKANYGHATNPPYPASLQECHDAVSLGRQLDSIHAWLARPEIAEWAGLALTPDDARSLIVTQGKMAVVISLEASDIMDEGQTETVPTQLAAYYDQDDVRTLQLVHELDNRFGGAPPFQLVIGIAEALRGIEGGALSQTAKDALLKDLYDADSVSALIMWMLNTILNYSEKSATCDDATTIWFGEICTVIPISPFSLPIITGCSLDELVDDAKRCLNDLGSEGFHCKDANGSDKPCYDCVAYASTGCIRSCPEDGCTTKNVRGLQLDGETGVSEMAKRGMPIDLAHMDENTLWDVDQWLTDNKFCNYPVYVSHGHLREAMETMRHEKTLSTVTIDMIARRGGLVGIRTGPESTVVPRHAQSGNEVQGSSFSFAQSLAKSWAHEVNAAFGVDMTGMAQMTRPRCETLKGEGHVPPSNAENIIALGGNMYSWDIDSCPTTALGTELDWRGLAHIGLLPDFMQDLILLDTKEFDPFTVQPQTMNLNYGAGAYVAMWERSLKLSHAPQWQQNGWSCAEIENLMWTHEDLLYLPHPAAFDEGTPILEAVEDVAQAQTLQGLITRDAVVSLAYDWSGQSVSADMPLHGAVGRYLAVTDGQRAALNGASPWSDLGPAGTLTWSNGTGSTQCGHGNAEKVGCAATWSQVPSNALADPIIPETGAAVDLSKPPHKTKLDPAVLAWAESCTSACQADYDACAADADCAPCIGVSSTGGQTDDGGGVDQKKTSPCASNSLYNSFTRCFSVHCGGVMPIPVPDPITDLPELPGNSPLD